MNMGNNRWAAFRSVAVVSLFVLSTLLLGYTPPNASHLESGSSAKNAITLGQAESITIGSFPDGASTKVNLEIPDGEAIQGIDIEVEPSRLSSSMAQSWTESNAFSTGTVYDGMDVNGSSLSILPQGWEYDFETSSHGWTLGTTGWLWGYDTSLGQAGGVSGGVGSAIYTYNGNYPNYMSSTTWATSPVMDCSSCSGNWNLQFQKRLGVESSSFDHAYVSVKGANGNWASVYSNSGTVNDGSMTTQTISITNYVANNPNFQVRFGLGTTDGSVTYTGWNVDDVSVLPTNTGVSSGEGNWTSAAFGPSLLGQGESKAFGYLHMDAVVPGNAVLEWRLLDAITNQPVAGFEHMTDLSVDLGMVDWVLHPLVRLDVHMKSGSMGIPSIHGFHFNGALYEDFDQDPTAAGWQLQGPTWSTGSIGGTGSAVSPTFNVRSGFGGVVSNSILTSTATLQASVDEGTTWHDLQSGMEHWFDAPQYSVQLRVISSGSWSLSTLDVEFIRTSVVDGLQFDVGLDGVGDWSMALPEVGRLGIQDRFINGELWQSRASTPSNAAVFDFALPLAGVDAFEFAFASPASPSVNPVVKLIVDGQEVVSKSVANTQDLTVVTLSTSERSSLNSALSQAVSTHGVKGLPMSLVQLSIVSSSSSTTLLAGGLFAPYDASLSMDFTSTDSLVIALNSQLHAKAAVGGVKTISLPIRMASTGALQLTVDQITTQASVDPVSIQVTNITDTFVPSTDWIDVSSTFDFAPLGVTDAASYVKTNGWSVALQLQGMVRSSQVTCPFVSLPASGDLGCSNQGAPMVWSDNGALGSKTVLGSGALLQIDHRFKFTEQWDDEPSLTVSVNLIGPTGPMIPVSMNYGLGNAQGVENDVELISWRSVNLDGVGSELDHPYLNPGDVVTIEAQLGFEGVENSPSPRSGSVDVCFYVDDVQNQCTSVLSRGLASFPWNAPTTKESVDLRIELVPLQGQSVVYGVSNSATFLFDSVAPELLGVNVGEYDHLDASPATTLDFLIADRPVLPSHAYVHMWRSWIDDANTDGVMDEGEISVHALELPEDRTNVQGHYLYAFDSSGFQSGSLMRGWLEVADSAGNEMLASGDFETPLFNLQINNDGAPQLGSTPPTWNLAGDAWLHPGEANLLSVPVWDPNGVSDIEHIGLDLASNHNTPVLISWNATTGQCLTAEIFIDIESCHIESMNSDEIFSTEGMFHVNFSLKWGFNPDVSLVRTPSVLVHDRSGQSNLADLTSLDWRFSGELELPRTSMHFTVEGVPLEGLGTWIQPRSDVGVAGELVWYQSQRAVVQDVDLMLDLGGIEASIQSVNGSFNGTVIAPLSPGTYGLTAALESPPNGAIDRTDSAPFAFFIVDQQAPSVVGVASPSPNAVIEESTWSNLKFEILIDEEDRLSEEELTLNWAVHEAGLGLASPVVVNGSLQLEVVGGRAYGEMIPTEAILNLDEQLTSSMRSQALELRIYITGSDVAGQAVSSVFNDIDAPLSVWVLEQRVAEYTFTNPSMKPSKDIAEGDVLSLGVVIENNGRADGTAQMFVERVESNGARTRIDAREISIPAGGQFDYSKEWMPDRSGTMWIEYHIIGGPSAQTSTVFVDEPRTEGILGSVAAVNPVLLVIIFLLTVSLVAVLLFGLQTPNTKGYTPEKRAAVAKPLPQLTKQAATPETGPYGAQEAPTSPGENPYQ